MIYKESVWSKNVPGRSGSLINAPYGEYLDHGYAKNLQTHFLCIFVANLKIDAIYTFYPESFCNKNLAIRKVFAFSDSATRLWKIFSGEEHVPISDWSPHVQRWQWIAWFYLGGRSCDCRASSHSRAFRWHRPHLGRWELSWSNWVVPY